jgi:cyclase
MRGLSFIALLALSLHAVAGEEIYPGYTWQALGNGIYLHSPSDPLAGPVDGNSTVIFNGDGVLVVDTHINPAVARAVIGKIRTMTDAPVTHVVNTHGHDDHTNGNHAYRWAYPDVSIIAHRETLKYLRDEWQAMEDQRRESYARVDVEELRRRASDADLADPGMATAYRVYAGYVSALRPELTNLTLEYPDTVLDDTLSLEFDGRRVEIRWLGRGNTEGDVVVWLPEDRVVITGDLLVAPIPFAFDSPMTEWSVTLGKLADLDARTFVPGHGAAQDDDRYLESLRALLQATTERVRTAREDGAEFGGLAEAVDLEDFRRDFAGDDPERLWAWNSYFVAPGLKSAWTSLGYPVPEDQ